MACGVEGVGVGGARVAEGGEEMGTHFFRCAVGGWEVVMWRRAIGAGEGHGWCIIEGLWRCRTISVDTAIEKQGFWWRVSIIGIVVVCVSARGP